MKIALVIYRYGADAGGVERYVFNLAAGLLSHGHEVHLFASEADGVQDGVALHTVAVNRLCSAAKVNSFARNSARMLQQDSYDVIHGFSRTWCQDVYRIGGGSHMGYLRATHRLARSAAGRALLMLNPRNRAIVALERHRYLESPETRLTAISEMTKREVVEEFGVPPERIQVIYNPVDTARFSPAATQGLRGRGRDLLKAGEEDVVALFVGTGFHRKGLDLAIEALVLMPGGKRPLLAVAGRDDPAAMKRLAERREVLHNVRFVGSVPEVELLYAAADYFVFPSRSDAFGQSVLEAMACGLPVVVSPTAGASEIVENGGSGLLLSDDAPRGLAEACERLADPATRRRLGAGAAQAAARFTLERNLEETLKVYSEVCDGMGRAGKKVHAQNSR